MPVLDFLLFPEIVTSDLLEVSGHSGKLNNVVAPTRRTYGFTTRITIRHPCFRVIRTVADAIFLTHLRRFVTTLRAPPLF